MFALLLLLAGTTIDPGDIDRQVERHLGAAIGEPGGAEQPVDPRLKLARCDDPLSLTPAGARGELVRVECPGGWRLFVRTSGGAPASSSGRVEAKAAPVVRRGQEVTLRASGPGFVVSQSATALEDGAAGVWVRVRRGRDVLRGRVADDGTVEVSPSS